MQPLQLAIQLARQAGRYQIARQGDLHRIDMKGVVDPVSEVDRACEQMIVEGIRAHFPEHAILAEESGQSHTASEWQWVVDPLDGTINYLHGFPMFCVCIALRHRGRTVVGVIYEPNRDEMFVAATGAGATCNERRITVSSRQRLIESVLATGFAYDRAHGELGMNIPIFTTLLYQTCAIRRPGSAGVDLAYVACGRFDGFWEYYLKPWDMAAGALLVEEAGGRVTQANGQPFDPLGIEIVATNGQIHHTLCQIIHAERSKGGANHGRRDERERR